MTEQYAALIEPVARALLGEPNKSLSSKTELRYGSRGSLSINLEKGTWFDHESQEGGGLFDLVAREANIEPRESVRWLSEHGFDLSDDDGHSKTNGRGRAHIVAAYDYREDTGDVSFQVVRYEPKDFRQRRPDLNKREGWDWSVKGVRPIPYRLPELLEAIASEHVIFIVEGEKDVDGLRQTLNVPATCNAGGVGKWHAALTEFFRDADVVVIPDNDPQKKHPKTGELLFHDDGRPIRPGQDHAHAVAKALDGTAKRVRYLDLSKHWPEMPPKGDVSDWINAGGTADNLFALVEQAPDWTPDLMREPIALVLLPLINILLWYGVEPKPHAWAVPELIPAHNVTLLSGQGGIGKTLLMQQLSVATVLGKEWIGTLPVCGPVLFITAEDDEDELHFRYDKIAKWPVYNTNFEELAENGLHLLSLAGKESAMAVADARGIVRPTELFEQMRRTAREIRPCWIALDTAADIFIVNERDRSQVRQCISLLRGVALEINTAMILLSHPSLSGISSGTGLSGSTAWNNSVRSRLYLKTEKKKGKDDDDEEDNEPEQGSARILEAMKSNYSALAKPIRLVWHNGLLVREDALPKLSPIDRASLEQRARDVFLDLLRNYNKQDRVVSYKEDARNFAPKVFAARDEAKPLHPTNFDQRKKLLRQALEHLLDKGKIETGMGPKSARPSKRYECLYVAGPLL